VAKKIEFSARTTASYCKNLITTSGFEKNANFFRKKIAKKSQKIAIITSTPGPNPSAVKIYIAQSFCVPLFLKKAPSLYPGGIRSHGH
jgi:hypothetical protein